MSLTVPFKDVFIICYGRYISIKSHVDVVVNDSSTKFLALVPLSFSEHGIFENRSLDRYRSCRDINDWGFKHLSDSKICRRFNRKTVVDSLSVLGNRLCHVVLFIKVETFNKSSWPEKRTLNDLFYRLVSIDANPNFTSGTWSLRISDFVYIPVMSS